MKAFTDQRRAAFTLIEMLAVMAIIAILVGIVIGGTTFVREKQKSNLAKVQIALLAKAIDEYHADNGKYPPTENVTSASAPDGTGTSSILFEYLFYNGSVDPQKKIYLPELDPESRKLKWTKKPASAGTIITDPWGNEFCYRSKVDDGGTDNADTINPDFDLWSMGKDGETDPDTESDASNLDDIKID
jgi:general secretion pathway protein G